MLENLSGDRVRHELELIFAEPRPEDVLVRLESIGSLATLHPALRADDWPRSAYAALRWAVARPLWPELAALPNLEMPYFALLVRHLNRQELRRVCRRIKVQRKTVEDLAAARDLLKLMPFLSEGHLPSELDAALRPFNDRVLLIGWAAAPSAAARAHIEHYARTLRNIQPHLDGRALIEMGLKPGPQFGAILNQLRAARLDGQVSDEAGERALLDRILKSRPEE